MEVLNKEYRKSTIGEIVADNYQAAGIFRRYGLDFCCGGGVSLDEACKKNNIDIEAITRDLERVSESHINYNSWSPSFLIDYIINTHHQFVRMKIDEIKPFAGKVSRVYGERQPETKEIYELFCVLADEMQEHLESEEQTVFPMIRAIAEQYQSGNGISSELSDEYKRQNALMEDEHETAGSIMKQIRKLSNDFTPPDDACTTYRILYKNLQAFEEDLHKHVHLENNILFKKAEALVA